jgi:hypothetical protein
MTDKKKLSRTDILRELIKIRKIGEHTIKGLSGEVKLGLIRTGISNINRRIDKISEEI